MRKIIVFNMVTLDGFVAGPSGDIDWHRVDEEFNQFAIAQLDAAGGLIFGRVTYELMAGYWPTPLALEDDPIVAHQMNILPKIVVSRTLERADWHNTRLIKANFATELKQLKQQSGSDLFVFGSANLVASLIREDLIDEYRILVNPVVLGSGQPLFQDFRPPLHLKLIRTETFQNGNVMLVYTPDRQGS
jgi:dihydrofolate reductase